MKLEKKKYTVFLLIILCVFTLSAPAHGAMSDYCVTPPFLSQSIPPNVLIVLDNSGSMCGQAYAGSYDPAQFANGQYYGYFDGSKNYRYSGTGRWEETTAAMTTGTAANPIANGSFLNWATMRRVEVAKKLLIGGKSLPQSWLGTASVRLDGETACGSSWNFQKDHDTSTGGLIYPFVGNYRFSRSSDDLNVTPLVAGTLTERRYPTGDVANGAWTPNAGTTRWSQVDEAAADDNTTYIQNTTSNTNDQVILEYTKSAFSITGTITSVSVVVRARKATTGTMRIQGVLRVKDLSSVDADSISSYSNLSTSYDTYQFDWATNPQTGLAWTWNDLTTTAVGSLTGFGVKAYTGPSSSQYPRVTQIYLLVTVSNPTGGPYNTIIDLANVNATGIITTLSDEVRFGLAYYAGSDEGAKIDTYINFATPVTMVNSIGGLTPSGWTPLGESLYEMTRFFRQDAPYYGNTPADYSTGLSYDPYYYNYATLTDRYVPCAKSFILFLTDGESTQDTNIPPVTATPSPYSACTLTNIKACSGFGIPDTDGSMAGVQRFAGTTIGATYASSGTDYMIDVAYWAKTNDMRPGTCTTVNTVFDKCIPGTQNISLYSVFMFGKGSTLLKDAAIYGGFNDLNGNNKPDCATIPKECYKDTNKDGVVSTAGVCSNSISTSCTSDAGCTSPGICQFDDPITYYEGEDGYELEKSILSAISDILRRVTSGTAASVLASGEGSGANLIQATYYPKRMFGSDEVSWIGAMQNLWYYVDPFFSYSNIREEGGTTIEPKDYILNLLADEGTNKKDYILQLYFDTTEQKARAKRFTDPAGTGAPVTQLPTIDFENLGNLWNAGPLLWSRNLSSSPRTIKTWFDKDSDGVVDPGEYIDFSTTAYNALSAGDKAILNTALQAADDPAASRTISYTHGYDKFCTLTTTPCAADSDCVSPATCSGAGYRSRTVPVDLNGDGDFADAGESAKVWKLGDIINSTPQIASWTPINDYDDEERYADASYADFYNDTGSTLPSASTARYKNRGMVFVGANDGMLHAFKLGKLGLKWTSQTESQKATLGKYCAASPSTACVINTDCPSGDTCTSDTDLGREVWAFIPKNVLPYLKYAYDPAYCHIYSVDLAPFIFDASIEGPATACMEANYWDCPKNRNSWRTILIGGMRYGGACKDPTYTGTAAQGVKVPVAGVGYSSYFALDITDPYDPQLLWEFASPDLGFSTTEGNVVRMSSRTAGVTSSIPVDPKTTNGRWFVVFGSGPTGGINTSDKQFLGNSDQNLRLFILDLKTGSLARTIDTGIANAFAGSLFFSSLDSDADYQDDVVYIPYVRKCALGDTAAICDSAAGQWNNGGVLRLLTNEDLAGSNVSGGTGGSTALNPANWQYSRVMDDTGPVTSSVVNLQDTRKGKLWIYFGTGRYFYKLSTVIDDADKVRNLYGLKDPCFIDGKFTDSCLAGAVASYAPSLLASVDLTTSGVADSVDNQGWKISLDDCSSQAGTPVACASAYFRTERVITNPLAIKTGVVFFTTLKPFDDVCSSGGNSAIWAVKYDTGGAPGTLLQGKALIQVSTGAIEQVDLSTAFTEKSGRKTSSMQGVPPTSQGLSIMTQPSPVKRIIHMRER